MIQGCLSPLLLPPHSPSQDRAPSARNSFCSLAWPWPHPFAESILPCSGDSGHILSLSISLWLELWQISSSIWGSASPFQKSEALPSAFHAAPLIHTQEVLVKVGSGFIKSQDSCQQLSSSGPHLLSTRHGAKCFRYLNN